jgi:peptidoglycan/xylan/chitin deacetylase (PgdA/CDA1 family)
MNQKVKIESSLIIIYVTFVVFTLLAILTEMPNHFNSFNFIAFAQTDLRDLIIMNPIETGAMVNSSIETVSALPTGQPTTSPTEQQQPDATSDNNLTASCNCVIFRMDDIQDYWHQQAQLIPMDLFLSKNQSLSLGLIMNMIGNDSKVINKVREGYEKGLFELALHGWDHVDYTKLSAQEQLSSLKKSNEKMKYLFGNTSKIFIAPEDPYNNDTLNAMSALGIPILSSAGYMENNLNLNRSVFVADGKNNNDNKINTTIYHIPYTILFNEYINGSWNNISTDKILSAISANIKQYGYAVVGLHPQDFLKKDEKGELSLIEEAGIKDLSHLIDSILSKNIHITSFSKVSDW